MVAPLAEVFQYVVADHAAAFEVISSSVPQPQPVTLGGNVAIRFQEKTKEQALVIKAARLISGINAGWHLLNLGFLQELGALQRMLDEIDADIMFLAGPLIFGESEPSHQAYLDEFFSEEFDQPGDAVGSTQNRNRVSRKKIRAYNARAYGFGHAVDKIVAVNETVEKAYSGFIHASSVHTMDMYFGSPARWHIGGMPRTFRQRESARDFSNYIFRSVGALSFIAKAMKMHDLSKHLYDLSRKVGTDTGIE